MKKLFSLLFVALLAMTAWGATVTDVITASDLAATGSAYTDFSGVQKNTAVYAGQSALNDGVNIQLRSKNSNSGIVSTTSGGKLVSVKITVASGSNTIDVYGNTTAYTAATDLYAGSGNQGTKVGSTAETATIEVEGDYQYVGIRSNNGAVYISSIEITWETGGDTPPAPAVAAPVFNPNGGEITQSTEVTLTCATENASIYYWEGTEEEQGQWIYYNAPFYVNETKTFTAVAMKGSDMSEYTTVTFTRITPTCATPTFNPASGATFMQGEMLSVEISSATEGATITYTVNDDIFEGTTPVTVPVDETTTITAIASKEGYNNSPEATATYTMLLPYTVGGTATFVAETDTVEGGATAGWHTLVKDNVTMKFYGTVSNYTYVTNQGDTIVYHQYRIYKNYTIQFTTDAGNIRKIEFICDPTNPVNGFKPVDGLDMTTGIWQGTTRDITFSADNKQVRANSIIVTLDDQIPTVMAPTFDPNGGYFNASQEVTITCETEGAKIYYSYDNEQFEEYTAPITINEACTIYAYAIADGVQSETVNATFTQRTLATNIDEANKLANNTYFYFGGEAIVTYQNSGNTWIKDGTGYGLIYGNQVPTLPQGTVLKEGWDAQKVTYNTFPEFKFPNNVVASEDVVTVTPTEYTTVTTDNVHEYVILKDQTITVDATDTTGRTYLNADNLVLFNQFRLTDLPTIEEGKTYDVEGMVTIYKNKAQLYIISITEVASADLRGDVNKDGNIDIADVTALISHVLSKNYDETDSFSPANSDVNGDGEWTIADVTMLINRVLKKSW